MRHGLDALALALALAGVLAGPMVANAGSGASHEGANDPITEGWSLEILSPNTVSAGTETTASGQFDFWQTSDVSSVNRSFVNYRYYIDPVLLDSSWSVEATVRLVNGVPPAGWDIGTQVFAVYDGYTQWGIRLVEGGVALTSRLSTIAIHKFPMDTQSDYHTYRLVFHPNGLGRADDTADIFIDGNLIFSDILREDFWQNLNWDDPLVYFGSGNSLPTGTANWNSVVFRAAPTLSCVGFQPPLDNGAVTVKKNRVLPIKALLVDADGAPVDDLGITAAPVIQVMFDSGTAPAIDVSSDSLSAGAGTEGNQFEFLDSAWRFNLQTKNYSGVGTYTATIVSGDTNEYVIDPTCVAQFVVE